MEVCDCSINSNEAATSTNNRSESFILIVFYVLLNSLKRAASEVVELISKALVYLLKRDEGLSFIVEFHKFLSNLNIIPIALISIHFQGLDVSPLHTHSNVILPFIAATIVYQITYMVTMVIKQEAQDAGPTPVLRFICLISGIISIELFYAVLLSPLQLIKLHLYLISLMLGGCCLFYTANLVLKRTYSDGNQT